MSVDPIRGFSENIDFGKRFTQSVAVVASPAAAAETVIAQLTVVEAVQLDEGIWLSGWAALTIGTSGTALRLRLRRGGVAGTLIADTGALTGGIAAANLVAQDVDGVDTAPVLPNQLYSLTAQITAGAAASTVSAVALKAISV